MAGISQCPKCQRFVATELFSRHMCPEDYFGGFERMAPHPCMAATGTEGRCELCGGGASVSMHLLYEAEKYRQEGRDEVLLEVAALIEPPMEEIGMPCLVTRRCKICTRLWDDHAPECLWARAITVSHKRLNGIDELSRTVEQFPPRRG